MINPVILIVIPLLAAFLSIIFKKLNKIFLGLALLINTASLLFMSKGDYIIGGFKPPFGINLVLDTYSFIGVILLNLLFAIAVIMSFEKAAKYAPVLIIGLGGLNGMVLTGDLFNLFVFMEITAIVAYILSAVSKRYKYSLNYLIIGSVGSSLFLFGTIVLYGIFGTLNMADMAGTIMQNDIASSTLLLPILMIFIGLAVEIKLIPFNGWAQGIFGNADGLVGPILASPFVLAILFIFGRLFNSVFYITGSLKAILLTIAVLTLVLGEFAAYSKKSLREILLFSSIAQSGLVVIMFLTGLIMPAILQLISNVVSKLVLFTVAGTVAETAGTDQISDLRGIFKKYKLIGFGYTVATLSLIGLPLFYGFYAKLNILLSLFMTSNYWLPAIILFAALIEGIYFLRMLVQLWNPGQEGEESKDEDSSDLSISFNIMQSVFIPFTALLIIAAGIIPFTLQSTVLNGMGYSIIGNLPGYLLLFTIAGAVLSYFATRMNKKAGAWMTVAVSLGALVFCYTLKANIGEVYSFYMFDLKITDLGWFFAMVMTITYFATSLFNPYWMEKMIHPGAYNLLYLLSLAGTLGLFFASDFLAIFIFWELVVWASMFIIPFGKSRKAAVVYYGISAFGSFSFLYAVLFLYSKFQTFDIGVVLQGLSNQPITASILFFMIVLSGLTKLGIFPFHIWLPIAHGNAPHTFSPVLSGGLVKMGAYIAFLIVAVFPSYKAFAAHLSIMGIPYENHFLLLLGAISIVVGTVMAIRQEDAKRLLAYSTVANSGYILIGIVMADQYGMAGGLMHVFNHAVATAAAFLAIAAVAYRTGTTKMSELGGMIHRMPITYTVYLMAIISLAGIPPMGGFVSKWLIFQSLAQHGLIFVALAAFFGSIGSFLYVFRPLSAVFLGQLAPKHEKVKEAELPMIISMVFLSALVLFYGVFPQSMLEVIGRIQASAGIMPVQVVNNVITASNGKLNTIVLFVVFGFGFVLALALFLVLPKSKKVGLMDTYTSAEFIHTPELLHYSHDFYAPLERLYAKHPSLEVLYDAVSLRIREAGQLTNYLFFSYKPGVTVLWIAVTMIIIFLGGVRV